MGGKGVRQFVLWAEYEGDSGEYLSEKVKTGLILNRSGSTYIVVERLSKQGVEKVLKG